MYLKTCVLLAIVTTALVAEAKEPRVALLLSADGRHHDEFDRALKTLGWSADRYPCKPDNMKTLAGKLSDYDLLLAAPLFSLNKEAPLSQEQRAAFRKFLQDGGVLAVTDGSYEGVREWLASIDPRFGGLESGKCNSSQWAVNGVTEDADPPHPLRFFPSRINEPNSWPHFHHPPQSSSWQVVAKCSEGHPVTFAQTVGKGFVSLSALRQPSAKQLSNFYACAQLSRAGIALQSFEMTDLAVGEGRIRLQFANHGVKEKCGVVYEVVSEDGPKQRFEQDVSSATFELPYRIKKRGLVTTRLLFKRGEQETLLFSNEAVLPPLLTVKPNAYRGILSTARRLPTVNFGVELAPDEEELVGATVKLTAFDSQGKQIAEAETTLGGKDQPLVYWQPLQLQSSLPAGDYTVRAVLANDKQIVAESEAAFKILAPQQGQTIIDEDNTLLVNGKAFFPLGLYHVKPADYVEVAALGINTVQYWTWDGQAGLDQASKHNLKAVFELNHKSEQIVRDVVAQYGRRSEVLMWYGLDEPAEGSYGLAATMRETFHACDDQRPVYMVSCRPDVFAEQAAFADVFAHDPYGKPEKTLDWMIKANVAVDHRKPVVCVPGVFGKETPEELRAAAYIALANDARGILWYPWQQVGGGPLGVGLKNSAEHQAVIKQLCSEIRALEPALTTPGRHPFSSVDGKLRGIYCPKPPQRYLLVVNATPHQLKTEAVIPNAEDVSQEFRDFFKERDEVLPVQSGKFQISLKPYETRVYLAE